MKNGLANNHSNFSFICVTISLILLVFLTPLFQKGMHADGVLYATIARNMSLGFGSIWSPDNAISMHPHFYEHPSVGLWLESLYFRVLGEGYLTERLFCLTEAAVMISGVVVLWKRTFHSLPVKSLFWIPIFLCFSNFLIIKNLPRNSLDTLVMCFSLWAVIFLLRNQSSLIRLRALALFFGCVCMFLGFLSNGFQAFFPLATPLIEYTVRRDSAWKAALMEVLLILLMLSSLFVILFLSQPAALMNIKNYITSQVLPSTIGSRSYASNLGMGRFHILIYPLFDCAFGLLVLFLFRLFASKANGNFHNKVINKDAVIYFLIAVSASFPVILAHRQSASYILQSMPFYALTLTVLLTPYLASLVIKMDESNSVFRNIIFYSTFLLLIFSLTLFVIKFGTVRRDRDALSDIAKISAFVGNGSVLSANVELRQAYGIGEYFSRKNHIELVYNASKTYYVDYCNKQNLFGYTPVDLYTNKICLYTRH